MQVSDFPILLVGDDADEATRIRHAFREANLVNPLWTMRSGEDLHAYLSGSEPYQDRREHPLPSLILLDGDHLGGEGLDLVRWIRTHRSLLHVSLTLAVRSLSPRDRQEAERLGVGTILEKPVDTEGLFQMLIRTGRYWVILRKRPDPDAETPDAGAALRAGPPAGPAADEPGARRASGRNDTEILGDQIRFQKTSWDLVRSAEQGRGMDALIRMYWKPLYFFARQKGFDNETAKDLVQEFLADVLEHGTISRADPARGKFRTFLLSAFCNFMRDRQKFSNRQKRGGGTLTLSLDFDVGERQYSLQIAKGETPETILNRAWLESTLEEAIAELTGNPLHLRAFRLMIQGTSYSEIARETGLSDGAVKAAVFRLRQQLRDIVVRRVRASGDRSDPMSLDVTDVAEFLR
ncbi:MAG TPA: sigma-70 family RNA polymerase sigma factor [Planctomycetota bacterium]|nr:sigma-70 family RNA polymerase sigma factor [Planctomycetota bacterium]